MSEGILQYPGEALRNWLQALGGVLPPDDELRQLARLADTLFCASLGKEEGESTRVRVAYHPNGIAGLQGLREHVFIGGAHGDRRAWEIIPFIPESTITDLPFGQEKVLLWNLRLPDE